MADLGPRRSKRPKPLWCDDCGSAPFPPGECARGRCHAGKPPEKRAAMRDAASKWVDAFTALREAPALRAALIDLLWLAYCDGAECCCDETGPGAHCSATRALGWGDHWDPLDFSRLASAEQEAREAREVGPSVFFGCPSCGAGPDRVTRWRAGGTYAAELVYECRCGTSFGAIDGVPW